MAQQQQQQQLMQSQQQEIAALKASSQNALVAQRKAEEERQQRDGYTKSMKAVLDDPNFSDVAPVVEDKIEQLKMTGALPHLAAIVKALREALRFKRRDFKVFVEDVVHEIAPASAVERDDDIGDTGDTAVSASQDSSRAPQLGRVRARHRVRVGRWR